MFQPLGQSAQFGHRADLQLGHELGALRLDGAFYDLQLIGDLFVKLTGDDTIEDCTLAGVQRGKARAQPSRFRTGRALDRVTRARWSASNRAARSTGFVRKSTAPAFAEPVPGSALHGLRGLSGLHYFESHPPY
jgi:hypothetical protein